MVIFSAQSPSRNQKHHRNISITEMLMRAQVHHVRVKGGPNGYADFVRDIQSIFGITAEHDMQLAFDCADPMTGEPLQPGLKPCLLHVCSP